MPAPFGMLASWAGILGYQAIGFAAMAGTALLATLAVPPEIWGEYWIIVAVVQIVTGIALSWVGQSVLFFAKSEMRATGDIRAALYSALALQGCLFTLVAAAGWLLRPFAGPFVALDPSLFVLIAAVVALTAVQETVSYAIQADGRFQGLGLAAAASKLGPLLAVVTIWCGAAASPALLLTGVACGLAAGLAITAGAVPRAGVVNPRPSFHIASDIVRYGAKLPLAIAAGLASAWMHVWFVRAYGGAAEAGLYGWAASLHSLAGAALMPLSAVLAPHLLDLTLSGQTERTRQRADLFRALTVGATVVGPGVLGLVALGTTLLPGRYAAAGPILTILLSAIPAQLLANLTTPLLRGYPRVIGKFVGINVLMALASVFLNLLLTPRFGAAGAATALSISVWCGALAIERLTYRAVGGDATATASGIAPLAVAGVAIVAASVLAGLIPPLASACAGIAAVPLLLLLARRAGALRPLASFAYHLSFVPHVARHPLTRFFAWCDRDPGTSARGRTV